MHVVELFIGFHTYPSLPYVLSNRSSGSQALREEAIKTKATKR